MYTAPFLSTLQQQAQAQKALVQAEFLPLAPEALNFKPHAAGWSILECLEHLNRYSRFYLEHLKKALANTQAPLTPQPVRYTWLGRKSLKMVDPTNAKKHKTLQHMNPKNSQLSAAVMQEFLHHQDTLLHLLEVAPNADINKKAVPVEFFRMLHMRTGEALEFLISHQQRHLQQAQRVKVLVEQPIVLAV